MKNSFVVRIIAKRHVVVIALNIYLAASGAAIAEPSALKEPAFPPWHEWLEILNGCLQYREARTEKGVDVLGPRRSVGVDGAKLGHNGGTKSGTSGSAASVALSPKREAMGGEWCKESPSEGYQCDGYCGLYLSLPLWIVAYWIGLRPMNITGGFSRC